MIYGSLLQFAKAHNYLPTILIYIEVDMCANESTHNCSIESNEVCTITDTLPGFRCECRAGFNNETGTCIGNVLISIV